MGRQKSEELGEHQEFAARLRQALEKREVTGSQKKIGARFGVSGAFFGQMINGQKLPGTETCAAIATSLRISFEWLATGRGSIELVDYSSPEVAELCRIAEQLPRHELVQALAIMRVLESGRTPEKT